MTKLKEVKTFPKSHNRAVADQEDNLPIPKQVGDFTMI